MKLTISQGIRLLVELRKKQTEFKTEISKLNRTLTVNGEDVVSGKVRAKALKVYREYEQLTDDIISLRNEINRKNDESGISELNVAVQEYDKVVEELSRLISDQYIYSTSSNVVSGVGVTENGFVEEKSLLDYKKDLEKEIMRIKNQMDEVNNSVTLDLDLNHQI